ncbi:MAG: PfkB family carbohydrate kinase [bacterium]|nr:PfkB family carbohydrate kinase [bacterium]
MKTDFASRRLRERREELAALRVATIGGANVEHGYSLPGEFEADAKYSVPPQPRQAGGSSVNHACRLLALGVEVHPVLPLAKADPQSSVIVDALDAAARTGGAAFHTRDLFVPGGELVTPYTTIIRQGASRAVLNEFSPDLMAAFPEHVERHLKRLGSPRGRPDVVVVGHVHADRKRKSRGEVGFAGEITERVLAAPELQGIPKVVNFGSAQFKLGTKRWEKTLRDHVDVFQLDIGEVRRFCRDADLPDGSLASILGWFRDRCTVVVSLERFGAIGQLAGSDRPVAAWPYLIEEVVDSTGAGDAMGAGIVASLALDRFVLESDDGPESPLAMALAAGRACAAHACTTIGGAADCPDLDRLVAFEKKGRLPGRKRGVQTDLSEHELFLIDRAFDA